jgi:hypothetical protein
MIEQLKELAEGFNNQSLIVLVLAVIAVDILHFQQSEIAMQIINTIVSGLLGMAMGRTSE